MFYKGFELGKFEVMRFCVDMGMLVHDGGKRDDPLFLKVFEEWSSLGNGVAKIWDLDSRYTLVTIVPQFYSNYCNAQLPGQN